MKTTFFYAGHEFVLNYDKIDWSGLGGIDEIATKNEYDFDKFVGLKNKVFVDIGANVGISTIIMAKLNPESIVYSFEPYSVTYSKLIQNIKENNLTNVVPFQLAVSNKTTEKLVLSIFDKTSGANTTYADPNVFASFYNVKPKSEDVECISFDAFLTSQKIDKIFLLKIDCEGAEFDIIYDSDLFKKGITENLVGEFHDLAYNHVEHKSADLINYCKKYVSGFFKVSVLEKTKI